MRLHILGTGEDFYIEDASLDWTVLTLRNRVASRLATPVPSDRVKLLLMGRVLRDSSTLNDVNLTEGQTVHMVVRPADSQTHQSTSTNPSGVNAESFTSTTQDMSDFANIMNGFLRGQLPVGTANIPNIFGGLQGAMQVSQMFSRGFGGANANGESGATNPAQDTANGTASVNTDTPSQQQQSENTTNENMHPHIEVITITTDENGQESRIDSVAAGGRASRNPSRRNARNPEVTTRTFHSPSQLPLGRVTQHPQYTYSPPPPVRHATVSGVQIHLHVSLAEMEQVPQAIDRLNARFAMQYRQGLGGHQLPVSMAGAGGISSATESAPIPANIVTTMMTRTQNSSARSPNVTTSPVRATSVKTAHPATERNARSAISAPSRASVSESNPPPPTPSTPSKSSASAASSISTEVLLNQILKTIIDKLEIPIDFMLLQQGDWTPASKTRLKVNALVQKALDDVKASHHNCGDAEAKGILAASAAKGFVRDHVYNIPILAAEVARHSKSPGSIKVNPMSFIERSVFHITQHLLEMYTSTPSTIQQKDPYKINNSENSHDISLIIAPFQSLPENDRMWCLTLRMGLVKTIGSALVFAEREIADNGRRDVEETLGKAVNMIFVDFILPKAPSLAPMRGMAVGSVMQTLISWRAEYIKKFLGSNIDNAVDDENKFTEEIPDYETMVRNAAVPPQPPKAVAGGKKERAGPDNDTTTVVTESSKPSDLSVPDAILESILCGSNESTGEPDAKKDARPEVRDNGVTVAGEARRSEGERAVRGFSQGDVNDTFASASSISLD